MGHYIGGIHAVRLTVIYACRQRISTCAVLAVVGNRDLLVASRMFTVAVSSEPRVTRKSLVVSGGTWITPVKVSSPSMKLSDSVGTCTLAVLVPLNVAVKRPPV